jgi:hypothetical protein
MVTVVDAKPAGEAGRTPRIGDREFRRTATKGSTMRLAQVDELSGYSILLRTMNMR